MVGRLKSRHAALLPILLGGAELAPAQESGADSATLRSPAFQTLEPAGEFAIRFEPPGQRRPVTYESPASLIVLRANVGGRDVWALLDTGASHSFVDAALARSLGLRAEGRTRSVTTRTGRMAARRVDRLTFSVAGQFEAHLPGAFAIDLRGTSAILGRPVEAILGRDILSRLAVHIDPANRTLAFGRSGEIHVPDGSRSVPVSRETLNVTIRVGSRNLSVMLDLGSNMALGLRAESWAQVAPPSAETRAGRLRQAQGEIHPIMQGQLPEVGLGTITAHNVATAIFAPRREDQGGKDVNDGIIGMRFFPQLNLVIDAPRGRLWFFPSQADVSEGKLSPTP